MEIYFLSFIHNINLFYLIKGLNSSGTNKYPIKAKLIAVFLLFAKNPTALKLITLYMKAADTAIKTDLVRMSPIDKIFYSLNLVIAFAPTSSKELNSFQF